MFQSTYGYPMRQFATIYIFVCVKKENTTHEMRCSLNFISV